MHTQLIIKDIRLFGYHGVYDEEHATGTQYKISVILDLSDNLNGAFSDNIRDTVNYEIVIQRISQIVTTQQFHLIERLCQVIGESLLDIGHIQSADVTVEKYITALTPSPQWFGVRRIVSL